MRYPGYIFKIQVNGEAFADALKKYEPKSGSVSAHKPLLIVEEEKTESRSREVFIVHGKNETVKEKVARFMEKLKLNPIILHEQTNEGRTIIEKFEQFSKVPFAVVLMTADDIGGEAGGTEMKPRARQNVVLEQGYFFGALGRKNVCALYVEGVELPSDLLGVLYVKLDDGDAWQLKLAKEMKAAGLSIDLNLL